MACPTGLLHKVLHSSLGTLRKGFRTIVAELLGKDANEKQVLFCYMNVMDMCFGFVRYIHQSRMPHNDKIDIFDTIEIDIEDFADHIFKFSMSGINTIRKENKNKITVSKNNIKK